MIFFQNLFFYNSKISIACLVACLEARTSTTWHIPHLPFKPEQVTKSSIVKGIPLIKCPNGVRSGEEVFDRCRKCICDGHWLSKCINTPCR